MDKKKKVAKKGNLETIEIKEPLFEKGSQDENKIKKYKKYFDKQGLYFSRRFGSKTGYKKNCPNNLVVFNARIYLKQDYEEHKDKEIKDFFEGQKLEIWYGDLNLNLDIYKLFNVYMEIRAPIVITYESGRKVLEIGSLEGIF